MKGKGVSGEAAFTVLNPVADEPERDITPLNPHLDTLAGKKVLAVNLHGVMKR